MGGLTRLRDAGGYGDRLCQDGGDRKGVAEAGERHDLALVGSDPAPQHVQLLLRQSHLPQRLQREEAHGEVRMDTRGPQTVGQHRHAEAVGKNDGQCDVRLRATSLCSAHQRRRLLSHEGSIHGAAGHHPRPLHGALPAPQEQVQVQQTEVRVRVQSERQAQDIRTRRFYERTSLSLSLSLKSPATRRERAWAYRVQPTRATYRRRC